DDQCNADQHQDVPIQRAARDAEDRCDQASIEEPPEDAEQDQQIQRGEYTDDDERPAAHAAMSRLRELELIAVYLEFASRRQLRRPGRGARIGCSRRLSHLDERVRGGLPVLQAGYSGRIKQSLATSFRATPTRFPGPVLSHAFWPRRSSACNEPRSGRR